MQSNKRDLTEPLVANDKRNLENVVDYGVDVSYPMQNCKVSHNFVWLPHNVDPTSETPEQYREMPIQPLGDRQKFYLDLVRDCEEYFNKNFKGRGDRCQESEKRRIQMARRQPQSMQVEFQTEDSNKGFQEKVSHETFFIDT